MYTCIYLLTVVDLHNVLGEDLNFSPTVCCQEILIGAPLEGEREEGEGVGGRERESSMLKYIHKSGC